MKTERTILELLILLRENIEGYWKKYSPAGLCFYIRKLWDENLITTNEKVEILDYIFDHRPHEQIGINGLWWDKYEIWPRIEFLDKLIKQKQNENHQHQT